MADNTDFIEKADQYVATLGSNGTLVAEQAQDYLEILTLKSKFLKMATVVSMDNPSYVIPKIGFTGEVLKPGIEGEALGEADRSVATYQGVTLTPKEYVAELRTTYSAVEDSIKRNAFGDYLKNLFAVAVGRDVEKACIQGNTAGTGSALLRNLNGIITQTTTNVVDAANARLSKALLVAAMRALPDEFDDADMVVLTNKNAAIDYWNEFSDRQTPLGDASRTGRPGEGRYGLFGGLDVVNVPLWPRNLGGSSNQTTALLCNPKNCHVGFRRQISIETEKDISRRMYKVVVTVRFDVKWAHEPATVQINNVLAAA